MELIFGLSLHKRYYVEKAKDFRKKINSGNVHMPKTMKKGVREMSLDIRIRKVKVLQGRAKEEAIKQGLAPNDLVILTTSVDSLPEYGVEKIDGDPVSFLLKRAKA